MAVNKYTSPAGEEEPIEIDLISPEAQREHVLKVQGFKEKRQQGKVKEALKKLYEDAPLAKKINIIPSMLEATRSYATIGEIWGTIRRANGHPYDPFGMISDPFL